MHLFSLRARILQFLDNWYRAVEGLMMHSTLRNPGAALLQLLVVPLRDTLSFALWGWSFATRRVHWRDDHFQVTRDGSVQSVVRMNQ